MTSKLSSKYKYMEEEDIILTPRKINTTHKKQVNMCMMNPIKKIEQAEYQFRRNEFEMERLCMIVAKEVLDELPNDIIDKILRLAGFYIPTVICRRF